MTTAYVYDARYLEHASRGGNHPERPTRLTAILDLLARTGALAKMTPLHAVSVSNDDLLRVHTPSYVAQIREFAQRGGGLLDADTFVADVSYDVARLAAGGCVVATDAVIDGRVDNALALIRPPGHHSFADRGEGFCLFNNVAIAAAHARTRGLRRAAIFDFDVHHGNGTQAIFYGEPDVLYVSTHQWPLYPGTGHWRETGAGAGRGATINVPFPPGVGDMGLRLAWTDVIRPAIVRFEPDIIFLSAGFDAHWRDPLAMLQVSMAGYHMIAQETLHLADEVCKGHLVVVLEGGYDLDALSYGTLAIARVLLRDPAPLLDPLGPSTWPEEDTASLVAALRRLHELDEFSTWW
ncbi:MAG: histone deacetylase [Anaerolineae bacterium]